MKSHNLTIIATGLDPRATDFADRLYEAGCDDATVSFQKGLLVIEFDREARTFLSALFSALRDVKKAGATIERVEPDYLVSAAEIAKRAALSRSAITLYVKGERGRGFPHPVACVTSESPLYDWGEVAAWLHRQQRLPLVEVVEAKAVREVNRYFAKQHSGASYFTRQLYARRMSVPGGRVAT